MPQKHTGWPVSYHRRTTVKRHEKRQRTRRKVLDAADRVFARRGYHEATLGEIASVAGVSKGAVYYSFQSKQDLFLALLEARMDERIRAIEAAFEDSKTPARRVALDYIENLKQNEDWIALFFEFAAQAARGGDVRDHLAERFRGFWATLAKLLEQQARERGIDLPLPAEHLAIAMDLLGIGFMLPRILDPDRVPDDLLGQALAYMLRGVADAGKQGGLP